MKLAPLLFLPLAPALALIPRKSLVARFNPTRTASNPSTPLQVGNGNFAFGADVSGLQTFLPFNTLSSWGWKNDSLPAGVTQADVDAYRGASWDNHGRPVRYDFSGASPPTPVEQWLISNPNRANLGRIGLLFLDGTGAPLATVAESDLTGTTQTLDLWTGVLTSSFAYAGEQVRVRVACAQASDVVSVELASPLLARGRLALVLDFPWNDGSEKFSAPFVGTFAAPDMHTTVLRTAAHDGGPGSVQAEIAHTMDATTFFTALAGDAMRVERQSPSAHRYTVRPASGTADTLSVSVAFSNASALGQAVSSPAATFRSSEETWEDYWTTSGFVDVLTGSTDPRAEELQRRIILSRYLMRVNEAGDTPPQESGLTNNGWYGKFHMEMYFWHCAHWGLWSNWDLLHRSSSIYARFLPSSLARAQTQQGWPAGARWPKMTDPSGRSSPGEINNLLVWEQPHALVFATYEHRAFPSRATLAKWAPVVRATADWMAVFAWANTSTGHYDLGPPMYVVSEDTAPNSTLNPAFELAYWRFGLGLAADWLAALDEPVPALWTAVRAGLAPLPVANGTYSVYEGIEGDFWTDPAYTSSHPALVGLYGWLPATPGLDVALARATAAKVRASWNATDFWGWDFPMLAMSAARLGDPQEALAWLLHPLFTFDDAGMPGGGLQVPTPYFPGAGALLLAVAMMAAGWDGSAGAAPGFPGAAEGWRVAVEGVSAVL